MKQGSGRNVMSGGKREPTSHAVSVDKVANTGLQIIRTQPPSKNLHAGRGFSAPAPVSRTIHKAGSQRKG